MSTSTDYSVHSLLQIQDSSVGMTGIWPGRYGAISLILFTNKLKNVMEATLKTGAILRQMDREGGEEPTKRLYTMLESLQETENRSAYRDARKLAEHTPGGSYLSCGDVGPRAYTDGRELYGFLEKAAFKKLSDLGGCISVGPFVVSANLFAPHLRKHMSMVSSKFE